jgi:alcohol dehydrogenase class IV
MNLLQFSTTRRIVSGAGCISELGLILKDLGVARALVVTDSGLAKAGLLEGALVSLKAAGLSPVLYDRVVADPPETVVEEAVAFARANAIDGVVGFGGGSSMDAAKLVAFLAPSTQKLPEIYGIGLAKGARLPLVQVPTTAGTGSEVTDIAIVTTPTHEKKGVVSHQLLPDVALLDAALTLSVPPAVTAATGIDAMVHAIEAYTSKHKKNPISDALARQALDLLGRNIRKVCADGNQLAARGEMLMGSLLAGMAFANAPVAAVHALAYPIGGHFHVPHGLSNALMLAPVLEFNLSSATELYGELATVLLPGQHFARPGAAAEAFVEFMVKLVADMPMAQTLREVGVKESDLDMLATDALKVQRLLINNPRDVTLTDARALYAQAL